MDDLYPLDWGGFQWGLGANADGSAPAVYVFSDNDVHIRNNGAPELTTKCRSSFDPEPHWLDDPAWYDDGRWVMSGAKVEGPDPGEAGFQSVPGTNADRTGPAVTDDTRNTGAPELTTNFRSAFDPELHSLDGPTWDDDDGRSVMSEDQHGLRLDSTYQ